MTCVKIEQVARGAASARRIRNSRAIVLPTCRSNRNFPEKYHRAAVFSSSPWPFHELARPLCASDVRTNGRIHPERVSFRSSSTKRAAERHRRLQLLQEGRGAGRDASKLWKSQRNPRPHRLTTRATFTRANAREI